MRHVSWSLDAVIDRGEALGTTAGRYQVETATLGSSVYLHQNWDWFSVRIGGGLRVGAARSVGLAGARTAGTFTIAPWGWPLATLSLSARPSQGLVFEAVGETSYVLLPLGNDKSSIGSPSLRGMWYGLELGVGIVL